MSGQEIKPRIPPARPKASLIAAATASANQNKDVKPTISRPTMPSNPSSGPSSSNPSGQSSSAGGVPMAVTNSVISEGSSGRTPTPAADGAAAPAKLKFKPKQPPQRRTVKQEVEVKAEPSTRGRGAPRARGRGGATRGRAPVQTSVAAGPLGGPRAVTSGRKLAPPPAPPRQMNESAEVYSDREDEHGNKVSSVIDIDAVSGLGESAPTSLVRDRDIGKSKAKLGKAGKAQAKEERRKRRKVPGVEAERSIPALDMEIDEVTSASNQAGPSGYDYRVKDEPISPEKLSQMLPEEREANENVPPPGGWYEREDDTFLPEDASQDLDHRGARVRGFMRTGGIEEDDDINEAQAVDLSESESEEEEEGMEGDFVQAEGSDNPEDKLFIFQFPTLFPKFIPNAVVDATEDSKDGILPNPSTDGVKPSPEKDVKPNLAALRGKKKAVQPEGQIGRLVVMKSGRVKMVLGDGIVMDVTPGVPATFLQQLVHLDSNSKSSVVLGEVHKQYLVSPDIDRLLNDLYLNGGKTPGDIELEERRKEFIVKMERGLVKMEID